MTARCRDVARAGVEWRDVLFPPHAPLLGACACGAEVRADSFRDLRSRVEYRIAGKCQSCQDDFYLGTSDRDDLLGHRLALRAGLVVGHRLRDGVLDEVAVMPFVFTAPHREVAWEARAILRAGPSLERLDPWEELEAMRPVIAEHQIRVACADSLDAAQLAALVGEAELVIADPVVFTSLGGVASVLGNGADDSSCGAPEFVPARLHALEAAVVRSGLDAHWSRTPEPRGTPSALRVCAWLGAVLDEDALDRILAARYSERGERLPRGVSP